MNYTYGPPIRWPREDRGLRAMCDYGASCVRARRFDAVEFHVMGCERDTVRRYMEDVHYDVPFRILYPCPLK